MAISVDIQHTSASPDTDGLPTPNGNRVDAEHTHTLKFRYLGIDTYQHLVVFMRSDSEVCRSEGFEAESRVLLSANGNSIIATLNVISGELLNRNELSLSEAAHRLLRVREGDRVAVSHTDPIHSFSFVRSKVYGNVLSPAMLRTIVEDIAGERYSDVQISAFVTACAGRLNREEIVALTISMIGVGERINWGSPLVVDKHCVGGLPGNRTTLIVTPIVAVAGLLMPKTSSRSITSPSGTADTMEVFAPVDLSISKMRSVVEREGACIVWGGQLNLSPADEILIRIERALDIDTAGQLIASVISKKVAAGSSKVVLDIPVGPTAKVRTPEAAQELAEDFRRVGMAVGLEIETMLSDGSQPVGRGIGPALEARDALAVLSNAADAPLDLRERSLTIAGKIIEFSPLVREGEGRRMAEAILVDGRAFKKFQAICERQGGMRSIPRALFLRPVVSTISGRVVGFDNRRIAQIAKLAGAPIDKAAGIELHVHLGAVVERGEPLYTVHAENAGELEYALKFAADQKNVITIESP